LDPTYHIPNDTRPIGLEVYQTVYVWNLSTTQDIIFIRYELKNISGDTLRDCYYGVCADNDIGSETPEGNDIISGIVGKWYVIEDESLWVDDLGYQWQTEEEANWDRFPGTIGFDYLQSPWDIVPGEDKDNDGIPDQYEMDSAYYWDSLPPEMRDADGDGTPDWRDPSQIPQLGMTAFKRFTLNLEPNRDSERYTTLAGYNFMTGAYEPYDTVPPDPDDQRFLPCSGPFDLAPESTAVVLVAVIFAEWYGIYGTPDSALVQVDKTAQFIYDKNWLLPGPPPPPQLTLIPGDVKVTLTWNSEPEKTPDPYYDVVSSPGALYDPFYREYDFEGYRIWRSMTGQTGDWHLLASYDLYNDVLFEDTTVAESIRIRAENTGIVHSYVDEDVRNGFTYYYAVTSFDYNFVEEEGSPRLLVFESGLSGEATSPRRDAWNFVGPGEPQFTVVHGNERLLDIVDAQVMSPLDVDINRPIYLEFCAPETLTFVVPDTTDTLLKQIYYMDGVTYTVHLRDADDNIIATRVSHNVIGKSRHLDQLEVLDGISASFYNGTDSFVGNVAFFDTVEITGTYPYEFLSFPGSAVPSNNDYYCRGFWAYRGNDFEVTWHKKDAAGPVNTVEVHDINTGEVLPFVQFQSDDATRHLAEGWCFTNKSTFANEWLDPVTDTLVAGGPNLQKTRALYICGGLVKLHTQWVQDTLRPSDGEVWIVRANREYTAAPVYGSVMISATPGYFDNVTQLTLNVKVAPNPYLVQNEWQISPQLRRLKFINLPNQCTIRIFNLNGELVKTLVHSETADFTDQTTVTNNAGGDEWWDLLSENRQLVSSGVYIFHVRSDVGEQVGKFVIIR
jgi:hypothetical protein